MSALGLFMAFHLGDFFHGRVLLILLEVLKEIPERGSFVGFLCPALQHHLITSLWAVFWSLQSLARLDEWHHLYNYENKWSNWIHVLNFKNMDATCNSEVQQVIFSKKVRVKITKSLTMTPLERALLGEYVICHIWVLHLLCFRSLVVLNISQMLKFLPQWQ